MRISGPSLPLCNRKAVTAFFVTLVCLFSLSFASAQDQDEKAPVIVPNTPYYEAAQSIQPAVLPAAKPASPSRLPDQRPAPRAGGGSPLVIPSGTNLSIAFQDELEFGDRGTYFEAALAEDLFQGNRLVAAKGTPVRGEVYRDPANDKLRIEVTDLQYGNEWQAVYTQPVEAQARKKGGGFWRKFATGLGVAGLVAGEALNADRGRDRRGCRRQRDRSAGRAALAAGAQAGGALLLSRQVYGSARGPSYRIKEGQRYSFTLDDDLRIP